MIVALFFSAKRTGCKGRDCIERIRKLILKHEVATDEELKVSAEALHLSSDFYFLSIS